jgi:hypothetical protein
VEHDRPEDLDLAGFLRMLPKLDGADLMAISAAYAEADGQERAVARSAAAIAAKRSGNSDELSRLQGSIIQWAGANISPSSAFTLEGLQTNPMLGDIRIQAVPPLLDAATALLLDGTLAAESCAVLLQPLGSVVG